MSRIPKEGVVGLSEISQQITRKQGTTGKYVSTCFNAPELPNLPLTSEIDTYRVIFPSALGGWLPIQVTGRCGYDGTSIYEKTLMNDFMVYTDRLPT